MRSSGDAGSVCIAEVDDILDPIERDARAGHGNDPREVFRFEKIAGEQPGLVVDENQRRAAALRMLGRYRRLRMPGLLDKKEAIRAMFSGAQDKTLRDRSEEHTSE